MNKTTLKYVNILLQKAINELESEVETLQEKMEAIEDRASDKESGEMTEREEERYEALGDQIGSIQQIIDDIENAQTSLYEF